MALADSDKILALDVGAVRIGLAIARTTSQLPSPLGALSRDGETIQRLKELCTREGVKHLVVGLPRGLDGQETQQTAAVRAFGVELMKQLSVPITWQDEAVTSAQAESELRARGKPYAKTDIDALAATYILEDYLR